MNTAEKNFNECRIHNIVTRLNDGSLGWPQQAPFDRIIVTAAAKTIPVKLTDQLADKGILIIPIGDENRNQDIMRVIKKNHVLSQEKLLPVRFVPLVEGVVRGS